MKRGRKQDDTLPPSRSREVQRAFRKRRAEHISSLERRVRELELESDALRAKLGEPSLYPGPTTSDYSDHPSASGRSRGSRNQAITLTVRLGATKREEGKATNSEAKTCRDDGMPGVGERKGCTPVDPAANASLPEMWSGSACPEPTASPTARHSTLSYFSVSGHSSLDASTLHRSTHMDSTGMYGVHPPDIAGVGDASPQHRRPTGTEHQVSVHYPTSSFDTGTPTHRGDGELIDPLLRNICANYATNAAGTSGSLDMLASAAATESEPSLADSAATVSHRPVPHFSSAAVNLFHSFEGVPVPPETAELVDFSKGLHQGFQARRPCPGFPPGPREASVAGRLRKEKRNSFFLCSDDRFSQSKSQYRADTEAERDEGNRRACCGGCVDCGEPTSTCDTSMLEGDHEGTRPAFAHSPAHPSPPARSAIPRVGRTRFVEELDQPTLAELISAFQQPSSFQAPHSSSAYVPLHVAWALVRPALPRTGYLCLAISTPAAEKHARTMVRFGPREAGKALAWVDGAISPFSADSPKSRTTLWEATNTEATGPDGSGKRDELRLYTSAINQLLAWLAAVDFHMDGSGLGNEADTGHKSDATKSADTDRLSSAMSPWPTNLLPCTSSATNTCPCLHMDPHPPARNFEVPAGSVAAVPTWSAASIGPQGIRQDDGRSVQQRYSTYLKGISRADIPAGGLPRVSNRKKGVAPAWST